MTFAERQGKIGLQPVAGLRRPLEGDDFDLAQYGSLGSLFPLSFISDGGCHGDRSESFRDSFHGQISSLGFVTVAICSDCHPAHLNLPASDAASSVHPDNLAQTCGQCHAAEINSAFLTYDPHLDAKDPASGPVYYVWLSMTLLIIGVFSFWGVHDLLWLQRSVTALNRGEYAAARRADGPFIRRFSRKDVWLHATVASSFLLLAVGFIFIFHFFHTHVRPESFPLDTTIFTGLVPLQRFQEERPLEYERLVQSGKLEQRLEEAPPRSAVVKAYVFGGLALTIGLLLALAVFVGLVFY